MDASSPNLNECCLLEYVAGRYRPLGTSLPDGVVYQEYPVELKELTLLPSTLVIPPRF